MEIDGKNYSFTQPVCTQDWLEENATEQADGSVQVRLPVVARDPDADWMERVESCCKCGRATTSGIFIRIDPSTVPYPREKGDDE